MTKQHFIALADALKICKPSVNNDNRYNQWLADVTAVANVCESQNSSFNRMRWIGYINGSFGPNGEKKQTSILGGSL